MTMRMLSVPLLLCAVMVLTTAAPTPAGEERCVKCLNEWNEHCYKFEPAKTTWADAEKSCLSLGGHLASIHDKTEHKFVQDLIRSKTDGLPIVWIGGYDVEGKNAGWMWSDGRPMTFKAWSKGEPNNYKGKQQSCMVMNFGGSKLWDDRECHSKFPSVCKIP